MVIMGKIGYYCFCDLPCLKKNMAKTCTGGKFAFPVFVFWVRKECICVSMKPQKTHIHAYSKVCMGVVMYGPS